MFKLIILLGINWFLFVIGSPHTVEQSTSFNQNKTSSDVVDDAKLNVKFQPELLKKYNYPVEIHEIKTEDGYLITMHRIPGQKVNIKGIGFGIPVMLMHGLYGSSAQWIDNGPKRALAYILADDGYDVWMGNARGSMYSKKHISLNPDKDGEYWQFSWHEIGYYDLPACIDYILAKTKKNRLHYVGHSQGTTVFFVMASTKPNYNEKIALMQALAPVAFNSHSQNPLAKISKPISSMIEKMVPVFGIHRITFPEPFIQFVIKTMCNNTSVLFSICMVNYYLTFGYDPDEFNSTYMTAYSNHTSRGISSRQHLHYAQVYRSDEFKQYDFGYAENMKRYKQAVPPKYNLSKITAPVALHYSDNDLLSDPIDVKRLYDLLGNPIGLYKVPLKSFAHMDYVWAIHAPTLLYDLMRKLMLKY